jgi:hypothetical protein
MWVCVRKVKVKSECQRELELNMKYSYTQAQATTEILPDGPKVVPAAGGAAEG